MGAALIGWHTWLGKERKVNSSPDSMKGCQLGPEFLAKDIRKMVRKYKAISSNFDDYHQRSDFPAITHEDYSARIQSVGRETNPRYWALINEFKKQTGYGVIVNTSFNIRGEPIVCKPTDAFRCFLRTEMDILVIGNHVFLKEDQKEVSPENYMEGVKRLAASGHTLMRLVKHFKLVQ